MLKLLLVSVVVACASCASLPRASHRSPAPTTPVSEYTVREVAIAGGAITVHMEIPPGPPGPKPAVIANMSDGPDLRAAGMIVVTYIDWWGPKQEPPATANPVGKWVLAAPSAGVLGREYLRIIARTGKEVVPKVVDYLVTDSSVDATKIGITGASTNGFVVFEALSADKRISAAVAEMACGDYHAFLRYSSMGMEGKPLALDPDYERWLREEEPISHPGRLVHAALLMVNQEDDALIPMVCAESTARVLEKAYARAGVPRHFKFVRMPEGGHGIGKAERQAAMDWLTRWF